MKLWAWKSKTLLKDPPTQLLYCEFFEIFQNTFFIEHLRITTSVSSRKQQTFIVPGTYPQQVSARLIRGHQNWCRYRLKD